MDKIKRGTLVICKQDQAVIDFFIHSSEGDKVLVQISESSYASHKSKYEDMNRCDDYLKELENPNDSIPMYVYMTTSTSLMKKSNPRSQYFNENVKLVSNSNGETYRLFWYSHRIIDDTRLES